MRASTAGSNVSRSTAQLLCLTALVALALAIAPSAALAATTTGPALWSSVPADGGTVLEARPVITASAYDPAGFKSSNFWMVLDGVLVTARFQWKIVGYNGTVPIYDKRYATLTYTPKSDLANVNHAVRANLANTKNVTSSYSWVFTRSATPQLFGAEPGAGSIVTSRTPTLSVRVTGVTVGLVGSFEVDGAQIPGVYSSSTGLLTAVVPAPLETDASHNVTATATNLGGASARLGWSVYVQLRPPMPVVSNCESCHVKTEHPMTNCIACHGPDAPLHETADIQGEPHSTGYLVDPEWSCVGCHTGTYVGPPATHQFTPDAYHSAALGTSCTDCHSRNLSVEHSRPGYTCLTCHTSTRDEVKTAIAAGNTDCVACHGDTAGHEAAHEIDPSSCTSCHAGTSLTTIHLSGGSLTCDSCHESGDPNVILAIQTGNKECSTCHPVEGVDYHTDVEGAHLSPTTSTCFGAGCHDISKDIREVHEPYIRPGAEFSQYPDTCALCHLNGDPDRIDWSRATAQCADVCHSSQTHSQYEAKHTPTAASSQCTSCHTTDLTGIHGADIDYSRCDLCHAAADNWTKSADCAECHTGVDHESMHETTLETDCASCHQASLASEHGRTSSSAAAAGCDSCHPSPKDTLNPWDGSCVQGGCHVVGTSYAQHAQIEAKHELPTPAPPCFGSGCHSGTLTELHSNASTTTAGGTRTGCNVCHTTTSVPTTTDCAVCHPDRLDPHGYEPAPHISNVAANLLTGSYLNGGTYSFRCDACHAAELGPEHQRTTSSSAAAGCGNCHPTLVEALTPPGWEKGCVQAGCHPAGNAEATPHGKMSAGHALAPANATCAASGCHDGGDLAAVHKESSKECGACHTTTAVPSTRVCEECHGQPHGDLNAAHTADEPGGLSWTNGAYSACTQCHYLDVRTEHAKASSGSLGCPACHSAGGPVESLPGDWNGKCSACHSSIHPDYDAEHVAYGQDCNGCHGEPEDARDFHRSCGASPGGGWTANAEALPCHTGPDYVPTPRLGPPYSNGYWCRTCHPDE